MNVLVIYLCFLKSILTISMQNKVYFPNSLDNLFLGRPNRRKAEQGECRTRGREKPDFFLLPRPALGVSLAMLLGGGISCPRPPTWTVPLCVGLHPAGHSSPRLLFLPGFPSPIL